MDDVLARGSVLSGLDLLSTALAVALCWSAVACTTPYHTAEIDPPDAALKGIEQTLREEGTADIILIHGMGPHSAATFAAENAALAKHLGRTFDAGAYDEAHGIQLPNGGLLLIAELGGSVGKLTTYAILWSPVDLKWKQTLCYDASHAVPGVCPDAASGNGTRAYLNGYLKSVVLDGALSDVVYYVSPEGSQKLRQTVRAALLVILAGGVQARTEDEAFQQIAERDHVALFEMSESLGSKILRDTLILMTQEGDQGTNAAKRQQVLIQAIGRTRALFMAANQVPILSTISGPELTAHFEGGTWQQRYPGKALNELHGYAAMVREGRALSHRTDAGVPLKVVAFSDPNDLFTYALRPYFKGNPSELVELIDVRVSNDATYAGLLENPWPAHTAYWQTDAVITIVKCGIGANAQGCQ